MKSLNEVSLIGRLGADIEMRHTKSGLEVVSNSLATDSRYRDKEGNQVTASEWHKVIFFGNLAGIVQKVASKGSLLFLRGALKTRKWEDKDGISRYTTEVIVKDIISLSPKKDSVDTVINNDTAVD